MNINELIDSLWEKSSHGTDRETVVMIFNAALEEAAKVCDGVYYQNIGPEHSEVRYGITACSVSIREKARALKGAKE